MKVTGMDHTGVTVKNLEKAIEFYSGVLGFKVVEEPCDMVTDKEESKALGLPECVHRICLLEVPGESDHYVEFMEYGDAPSPNDEPLSLNQIGQGHISLKVENMQKSVDELTKMGLEFLYKPLPAGDRQWVLVKDPDGIILELIG